MAADSELGYRRMRTEGFRCVALGPDNLCTVYKFRPQVCRKLLVGGPLCAMAARAF